ncbi:P-loop containing nucleoside triphosphate hydrolase protein [Mycena haematopus]|nr:P-loop containing nucleoside triphosphate hydrolase protein [Mycena haematopus]
MDSNSNRQGKWPLFQDQGHRRTPSLPNPTGTPQPQTTASTAPSTLSLNSPGNPLAPGKQRKQFQGGYEKSPKIPSYRPFSLNNPGTPRRKAFNLSSTTSLRPLPSLDPSEWATLALKSQAIPTGASLHSFQIQVANLVLRHDTDAVVISPTGSGKSLTWILPLLARKEGISLVVTPFTSLGLDGQHSNHCEGISSLFIYSEQNEVKDFELAAKGEMLVIYVCPEMLEGPSFAMLVHSESWRGRISALYVDEAHLVHQTHDWRPSYSRLYQLRNIIGLDTPLICLSATCPQLYRDSLVTYAGLRSEHTLVNIGNFRPELSTIILPMKHSIDSFLDIAFILPLGCLQPCPGSSWQQWGCISLCHRMQFQEYVYGHQSRDKCLLHS